MNAILTFALLITTLSFGESGHRPNETAAKKRSENNPNFGKLQGDYPPCSLADKSWKTDGLHVVTGLVERTGTGFVPGKGGTSNSVCALIAVENSEVKGLVEIRNTIGDIVDYTLIPGSLIGRGLGNFLLFPSSSPNDAPTLLPATCDLQGAEPQLALTLLNGIKIALKLNGGKPEAAPEQDDAEPEASDVAVIQ